VGINDDKKEKVAIKIIEKRRLMRRMHSNIGGDAGSMIEGVKKEIKMLSRFSGQHPNIIKLLDVIETRETVCTIMEYCSGGEYFDLIARRRRIPESEAKIYFKQLISALKHIHSEGASHRDLKPENILLDGNSNIKIGDFGLSCLAGDGKCLKTSCGSPNYAAPELLNGEPYDGCAADMWSTGVILYASIMGALPFDSA